MRQKQKGMTHCYGIRSALRLLRMEGEFHLPVVIGQGRQSAKSLPNNRPGLYLQLLAMAPGDISLSLTYLLPKQVGALDLIGDETLFTSAVGPVYKISCGKY